MAKNSTPKPAEKDFLVRDMPTDTLRRIRAQAELEERPLRALVVDALEDYLKKRGA